VGETVEGHEPDATGNRRWGRLRVLVYVAAFVLVLTAVAPDHPDPAAMSEADAYEIELVIAFVQALVITLPAVLVVEAVFRMARR
jgi:hypothetical protein